MLISEWNCVGMEDFTPEAFKIEMGNLGYMAVSDMDYIAQITVLK